MREPMYQRLYCRLPVIFIVNRRSHMPGPAVIGSVESGASSALVRTALTEIISRIFNDAKLDPPAKDAITGMQQHFEHQDFVTPLLRSPFHFGAEPFDQKKIALDLSIKVEANSKRLSTINNKNLHEAALLLWDLQSEIALHIISRRDEWGRSNHDHSFVLMFLHESVHLAFEYLCNKSSLTDEEVDDLKKKLKLGIAGPFTTYSTNTQSEQSGGARRESVAQDVAICMARVEEALNRFVTEKPLHESIDALKKSASRFNTVMKEFLLAVSVVPRKEGRCKQSLTWVKSNKLYLSKLAKEKLNSSNSLNLPPKKIQSTGFDGKKGTLYSNPFFERIDNLNKLPVNTQDKCYFHYIKEVFSRIAESHQFHVEQQLAVSLNQFKEDYKKHEPSDSFLLKDVLNEGDNVVDFVELAVSLYRQSYQLTLFMDALNQFMRFVGKLGLYNNRDLHEQLTKLINTVTKEFENNLLQMHSHLRQGRNVLVGAWLTPINAMMEELKSVGNSITREMSSFQAHFAKIIDPIAMQEEFMVCQAELLRSVLGLGYASKVRSVDMDAICDRVKSVQFSDFLVLGQQELIVDVPERMDELLSAQDEGADEEKKTNREGNIQHSLDNSSERSRLSAVEPLQKPIEVMHPTFNTHEIKTEFEALELFWAEEFMVFDQFLAEASNMNEESSFRELTKMVKNLALIKGKLDERKNVCTMLTRNAEAQKVKDVRLIDDIDKIAMGLAIKTMVIDEKIRDLYQIIDKKVEQVEQEKQGVKDTQNKQESSSVTNMSLGSVSPMLAKPSLSFMQVDYSSPQHLIPRMIEYYYNDVRYGKLVRNLDRKILKCFIWLGLNHVLLGEVNEPLEANNRKELILAVIKKLRAQNTTIDFGNVGIFQFNQLAPDPKRDTFLYDEFIKGDKTESTLKKLDGCITQYLERNGTIVANQAAPICT